MDGSGRSPLDTKASNSHIPPPTDPYITYQTPYTRRPSDDAQNPFIEFRRLADTAFSSFFSGLPRLLGTERFKEANIQESDQAFVEVFNQQAKRFESKIAEMVRARAEEAEGFRKSLEQEWEESRRANEKRMEEESQRWEMMRRGLERCPGLRPEGTEAKRQPESELDLYDGLKAYEAAAYKLNSAADDTEPAKCPWKDEKIDKNCPWNETDDVQRGWLAGLGFDGRRRAKNITLHVPRSASKELQPQTNASWREYSDEEMDPFTNDDHLVPWLKLSPYSPLSLIQGWKSKHDQAGMVPDLSDFPWDEAFEDLMSVHKTGRLPSLVRRLVYWGGPDQWMTEMALRGSLGPNWNEGLMVSALMEAVQGKQWRGFEGFQERCKQLAGQAFKSATTGEPLNTENGDTTPSSLEAENIEEHTGGWRDLSEDAFDPRLLRAYEELEKVAKAIFGEDQTPRHEFGARGMRWPSPEEVIHALSESNLGRQNTQIDEEISQVETSSWSSTGNSEPESIISTMTTTTSRTLPDGSLETKRVVKKRFANGREESSESTEINATAAAASTGDTAKNAGERSRKEQKQQKEQQRNNKGGWFWN